MKTRNIRNRKPSAVVAESMDVPVPKVRKQAPVRRTVVAKKSKVGTPNKTTKVVRKSTRKKVASPVKPTSDESEEEPDPDTEVYEDEMDSQGAVGPDPVSEIEHLRRRLLELEATDSSKERPLKRRQTRLENNPTTAAICTPVKKCTNPTEGKMLGRYDGRGDLETFLTKFQRCSSYFGWSERPSVSVNECIDRCSCIYCPRSRTKWHEK